LVLRMPKFRRPLSSCIHVDGCFLALIGLLSLPCAASFLSPFQSKNLASAKRLRFAAIEFSSLALLQKMLGFLKARLPTKPSRRGIGSLDQTPPVSFLFFLVISQGHTLFLFKSRYFSPFFGDLFASCWRRFFFAPFWQKSN